MDSRRLCAAAAALVGVGLSASLAQTFTDVAPTALGGLNLSSRSASVADFDDDGDLDLLFMTTESSARRLLSNQLVESGSLTFTDASSLLDSSDDNLIDGWSAAWGDYDGDGDIDVFAGMENSGSGDTGDLLRNDLVETGSPGFTDVTDTTIPNPEFPQNLAWCDIDDDSDLDLLIAMELTPHEIWLQGPAGSFTAVGPATGFADPTSHGYGMAVGDYDEDGDFDVYISTCIHPPPGNIPNVLFRNQLVETGSLSFVDETASAEVQYMLNSYGSEFWDFDDDGLLDLLMVGAGSNPSKIWINDGDGTFTDVDTLLGGPLLSYVGGDFNGGHAVDYDNDADLDLYFHDNAINGGFDNARRLFRNDGGWVFTDVTVTAGLAASNEGAYDSVWADLDVDGDLDLLFPNFQSGGPERLFESSGNANHWLFVELDGLSGNTTGIGAQVHATATIGGNPRTLRRDANANAGTFEQSDLPVHFGLGDATIVDDLRVEWPDGFTQTLTNVAVDQYLTVTHPTVPVGLVLFGEGS